MLDPEVAQLGQRQWISQKSYPSPVHIGVAPSAQFGSAYHTQSPAIRGVLQVAYSAPAYTYKSNQNMPVAAPLQTNLGTLHGAAPTQGVYTGIPSGCSNGVHGGNPYS